MTGLTAMLRQIAVLWINLTTSQKVTLLLVCGLCGMTSVGMLFWAGRPDFVPLYTNLSPSDASEMVTKIKESKVAYELSDGGSVIRVPSKDVYEVRMQLAGQGLPRGAGVGFEIFDKSNLGMTDFTQKLNYHRAMQGELSRTISQLNTVEEARVLLAIPEEEIFGEKQRDATASVLLKMRGGSKLDPQQARGIVHLVASSVEGLKPQNITVLDTQGTVLSDGFDGAGGLGLSLAQLDAKRDYESRLSRNIQSMLERALGPNKCVVRVNADMSMNREETKREIYEPAPTGDRGYMRSTKELEESYRGAGGSAGGPPGVVANLPGYRAGARSSAGGSQYTKRDTTTSYELNKRVEEVVKLPGEVKRLSVAVLLDGTQSSDQILSIRQMASAAAGIDPKRGDVVTVESVKFDKTQLEKDAKDLEGAHRQQLIALAIKNGVLVLLLVLGMVVLAKGSRAVSEWTLAMPGTPTRSLSGTSGSLPAVESGLEAEKRLPIEIRKSNTQAQVEEFVQKNPKDAAHMMKTWIHATE